MIVYLREPQFFPRLEYFHGLMHSDLWAVLDNIPYISRSSMNRCRVKTRTGVELLSISVKRPCNKYICETLIDNWQPWRKRFLTNIERNYEHAPFYNEYFNDLANLIKSPSLLLETFNMQSILWVMRLLDIRPRILFTRDQCQSASIEEVSKCITEKTGATPFNQPFYHPYYKQLYEPFEENLSVLDCLLNAGAEKTRALLH